MNYKNKAMMKALDFITEKIRSKEWSFGDKIWTELELCEYLDVSRVSVRNAIEKLVTLSIFRKVQGSGTYVEDADKLSIMTINIFDFSVDDLLDLLYFRLYFEYGNVRMFVKNADEEDMKALEDTLDNMQINKKNPDKYYYYDYTFHNIIARGTKNKFIAKVSDLIAEALKQLNISVRRSRCVNAH